MDANDDDNALQPPPAVDAMEEDDDEEEEEEEEEEESDSENEQPAPPPEPRVPAAQNDDDDDDNQEDVVVINNNDGDNTEVIEGGVAEPMEPGKARRKATDADIVLFLTCSKALPLLPDHSIFQPGVTVKIGLGKTSVLKALFQRYVEVCNEVSPKGTSIQYGDLEFVHSTVLNENDNAEAAALMKNDRITVRPDSMDERRSQETRHSMQRESDRRYFMVLRKDLLKEQPGDVFLRCTDDVVECHSFLVRQRCPWLGKLIDEALTRESGRQSIITVPGNQEIVKAVDPGAAHIEIDDDEPSLPIAEKVPSKVWVNIDYPVAAVKLLLEYCYTNRVYSLGLDAFLRSCKTTTPVHLSPVPPFSSRRWPSHGEPTVTLFTALRTITLATEADMPRLILQCEIAASHLVNADTAVSALGAAQRLPILRRAATDVLLRNADDLVTLDIPPRVIPLLLSGVSECVANRVSSGTAGRKRPRIDQSLRDANDRERERQSHRLYV